MSRVMARGATWWTWVAGAHYRPEGGVRAVDARTATRIAPTSVALGAFSQTLTAHVVRRLPCRSIAPPHHCLPNRPCTVTQSPCDSRMRSFSYAAGL